MASFTKYYSLAYFDMGDELASDYAIQNEIDRFVTLDKLIYGLMSIFGNGVIEGWTLQKSTNDSLTLDILEGRGHINFFSGITQFPSSLNLEPNNFYYIYAARDESTATTENVSFISSIYPIESLNNLLLGIVETGPVSITTIDMSGRKEIDFLEQIKDAIREHKHRGGALHPSKIDLENDVKGQLPGFRVADIDAAKVSSGVFDLVRLPLISHNLLKNIGQLTHAQIESFIKTLEVTNKELFGEVVTSNVLQQHILMKYLYDDISSSLYMSDGPSDKHYNNELIFVPGISPDSFIDTENTTAIVDRQLHEIRGIPPAQGSTFYINYETSSAWNTAYLMENVSVTNNKVTLSKAAGDIEQLVVENFESASGNKDVLSDGSIFKKEIINLDPDAAQVVSESSILNVAEGAFSAKVTSIQSFRLQYVKEYSTSQDWSGYDSFLIDIKADTQPHGVIKLYFVDSTGKESAHFVLLQEDELTENSDNRGFETRIISLTSLSFSNDIKKMVLYTDDLTNVFSFYIDQIVLQRAVLLPPEGRMLIRYSSSAPVIFNSLDWVSTEPTGTSIQIRARSANGGVLLNRSSYTSWLSSSQAFSLQGTDIEIEVIFLSDQDKISAPSLEKLRITILSDAEIEGISVYNEEQYSRGTNSNTKITAVSDKAYVSIDTPIYVGSHCFIVGKSVQQTYYDDTNSSIPFTKSEVAVFGTNTPISPNTIISRIEKEGSTITVQSSSLYDPKSSVRLQNRNFLIADTFNDRILEMDENSNIVNGYGSINYSFNKLFPIASCVDLRSGILYVVWSRSVPFKLVKVSKMSLRTTTTTIPLRDNYDKPGGYTFAELQDLNLEGQIMPIKLMDQNFSQIETLTSKLYLNVENDVMEGGIDAGSEYYRSIKTIGIPCFVGNFAYKLGIFAPTYANTTTDKGFIIANAKHAVQEFKVPSTIKEETLTRNQSFSDIVEIDKNGDLTWGSPSNWVNFSPFVPGRAEQLDKDTIIIAGIKPYASSAIADLNFTSISGNPDISTEQKNTLKTYFSPMVGTAGILWRYKTTEWSYITGPYYSAENILISDATINSSGNMVVAETSFEKSGRVITVDNFGNIDFSYGEGTFAILNDISVKTNGTIVITT
jgi:hypothetical protein